MIDELLNALKSRLEAPALTGVRDVEIAPGRFDVTEIERQSMRPPALRICFVGALRSKAKPNEQRLFDGAFSVFIVTEHKGRASSGAKLAEEVFTRLNLWPAAAEVRGAGVPREFRIDALYTAEIDRRGIALHAVSWVQSLRLGQDEIDAGPHDLAATVPGGADIEQFLNGDADG